MTDAGRCRTDDWVEVEYVLLEPADRSPGLPSETAEKPLIAWIKGFALAEASIGDELSVTTMTGRRVTGRLTEVNPGYAHTFGKPAPELVHVGRDLREQVAAYRARAGDATGDSGTGGQALGGKAGE